MRVNWRHLLANFSNHKVHIFETVHIKTEQVKAKNLLYKEYQKHIIVY